jgi:flagellin-like hook-associated protein FlgL
MAINSISSNIAAYSAQGNIGRASDKTSSSIDRLSSGNRIVRSSDDVSALVTGTVLRSTVTTLKQAFLNANQGSGMLQVADGALSQVTDILQRQKTLAVQAGSGSISDSERVFLNTEFQSLTDEINRIASNTRFSSVKLLDGSLSGSQILKTYTVPAGTTVAAATTLIQPSALNGLDTALMNGIAAVQPTIADGDQITVNGYTVTFTSAAQGTPAAAGKVSIVKDNTGAIDISNTSVNLVSFLNSSSDARIANLKFTSIPVAGNGGVGIDHYAVIGDWAGGALQGPYTINVTTSNDNIKVGDTFQRTIGNTASVGFTAVSTTNAVATNIFYFGGTVGTNAATSFPVGFTTVATDTSKVLIGANATETAANLATFLNRSTDSRVTGFRFINRGRELVVDTKTTILNTTQTLYATNTGAGVIAGTGAALNINTGGAIFSRDGLAVNRTVALGATSGSILVNSSTAIGTQDNPIDLRLIQDNPDFIGKLGAGNVGNITGSYSGVGDQALFSLKVGDILYSTPATTITSITGPVPLVFTGRDASGNASGGQFTINLRANTIGVGTINGQGNLDPVVKQINDALSGVTFNQNRTISSFQEGDTVSVAGVDIGTIDGMSTCLRTSNFTDVNIESIKIYAPSAGSSDARFEININGQTYISVAGIGNQIATNTSIVLQSTSNLQDVITLQTGNTGLASNSKLALDLSSQTNADAITRTIEKAYGLAAGSSKVSFQIGSSADDSLGVRIDNISTKRIYKGVNLSISTKAEAATSSDIIDEAIITVASVRASIGALQSRFDFAAVNIQASLQNQDAARGALLDTDMTAESTSFATSQVQLQAGIAVLAQANQLPQGLLKLLQ